MQGEYNRPRRPDPNTISYLRSLPLDEKSVHEEVQKYLQQQQQQQLATKADPTNRLNTTEHKNDDTTDAYPQSLLASLAAIDEIQHEVASLAGDEFGSQSIETLCRIGATYSERAARTLLHSVQGYLFHLSTHRFGSHVIQTLLQYSTTRKSDVLCGDLLLEVEGGESKNQDTDVDSIPSLQQLVISTVEELLPYTHPLSIHICGSHVLRTLICILCGVERIDPHHHVQIQSDGHVQNQRGKMKDKKKKKNGKFNKDAHSTSALHTIDLQYVTASRLNIQDKDMSNCRIQLTRAILHLGKDDGDETMSSHPHPAGTLQELACHVNGGPLLTILLQGLAYSNVTIPPLQTTTPSVQERVLRILPPIPQFSPNSLAEDVTKQILGWKSLEKGTVIYALAGHTLGSHLLETILRISHDSFYEELCKVGSFFQQATLEEYIQHDVSNFVIQTLLCTIRSKYHAEQIIDALDKFIQNGYVLDPSKHRRGIFWRLVELSSRWVVRQEQILESMKKGFAKLGSKDKLSLQECIPLLLRYEAPTKDGERIQSDPSGLRSIYHFLRFTPRLCDSVLTGIISFYGARDLELMACDSLASVWYVYYHALVDGIKGIPFLNSYISFAFQKHS